MVGLSDDTVVARDEHTDIAAVVSDVVVVVEIVRVYSSETLCVVPVAGGVVGAVSAVADAV